MDVIDLCIYDNCISYNNAEQFRRIVMKTFRITYTQASENTVEIEAGTTKDAWALVKSGKLC